MGSVADILAALERVSFERERLRVVEVTIVSSGVRFSTLDRFTSEQSERESLNLGRVLVSLGLEGVPVRIRSRVA